MQVTLEIPEKVAQRAEATGVDVATYVQRLIARDSDGGEVRVARFGPGTKSAQEAGEDIRELRKGLTLGGVKIAELIEEGRRY